MSAEARDVAPSRSPYSQPTTPPLQHNQQPVHMLRQQLTPPSADEADDIEKAAEYAPPSPHQQSGPIEEVDDEELPCPGCETDSIQARWKGKQRALNNTAPTHPYITIPPTSSGAEMTVMPFLAEHIPAQYNAVGSAPQAWIPQADVDPHEEGRQDRTSTRFCYRHNPDLKCRRQANETGMEDMQHQLSTLSQSDQQAISHVWSLFSAAPSKHRDLMLQGILSQCCFPQLSSLSSSLRSLLKIDFLSALPAELGFRILCFLDTTSLCKAAQVSRRWRDMADDDVVWHRMCEQHIDRKCTKCGWGLPLLERKRLRVEKRTMEMRAKGRGEGIERSSRRITEVSALDRKATGTPTGVKRSIEEGDEQSAANKRLCLPPSSSAVEGETVSTPKPDEQPSQPIAPRKRPWKDVYKARFKVGTNWKHGRFRTRVFRGHTNGVMCLQFDDNVLMTGSYDSTAKIWDVKTGEEIRTLRGHSSGIRCLQFDESKLITGSLDCTLRLWDWKRGTCLRVFRAHTAGIVALNFSGPWVASGSMDQTIRVWNSETQQTFLLRGHTDWINSVRIDEDSRTLFSGSDDLTVRLWDLDGKECIRIFEGHVGQVQQVLPLPAEFELDERKPAIVQNTDKDDDASSVTSGSAPTGRHSFKDTSARRDSPALDEEEEIRPFWDKNPDRPPPPRYMLTGALDATIRLWDVHFNVAQQLPGNAPTPPGPGHDEDDIPAADPNAPGPLGRANRNPEIPFRMLPTDPLTNSHTPRAQACVRTFFGHVEGIWALAADHLRLISGSEDRMMKVWDPRTGKCERTFTGHQGPVTCCWLSDWGVASGSEDCEVRMLVFGEM